MSDWNSPQGGLRASGDKDSGERYNLDKKGVYFHDEGYLGHIYSYSRFAPVFSDGNYVRPYLECKVDRAYKVNYKHRNQKVQKANRDCDYETHHSLWPGAPGGPSIYYKAIVFEVCSYADMPMEHEFSLVWNPALEARPWHIVERYGANRELEV